MIAYPCQYCGAPTTFSKTSEHLYDGKDYGPVWECRPCDAAVGCHKGTNEPLGLVADKKTRAARAKAHKAFDPLWQRKMELHGWTKQSARQAGYKWLAREMGLRVENCHIGNFTEGQCYRVVRICNKVGKK